MAEAAQIQHILPAAFHAGNEIFHNNIANPHGSDTGKPAILLPDPHHRQGDLARTNLSRVSCRRASHSQTKKKAKQECQCLFCVISLLNESDYASLALGIAMAELVIP